MLYLFYIPGNHLNMLRNILLSVFFNMIFNMFSYFSSFKLICSLNFILFHNIPSKFRREFTLNSHWTARRTDGTEFPLNGSVGRTSVSYEATSRIFDPLKKHVFLIFVLHKQVFIKNKRFRLRGLSHDLRLEISFNLVLVSRQTDVWVPRNDRLKVCANSNKKNNNLPPYLPPYLHPYLPPYLHPYHFAGSPIIRSCPHSDQHQQTTMSVWLFGRCGWSAHF